MKPFIAHNAYSAKDVEASTEFYKLLGFEKAYDLELEENGLWLRYLTNGKGQFLELFPRQYHEELTGVAPNDNGVNEFFVHMCLLVDDIEDAAHELQEAGVQLWLGPPSWNDAAPVPYKAYRVACNSSTFFITDPDNNLIEVMQYNPDSMQLKYIK